MDIETKLTASDNNNNIMKPISISTYDGGNVNSFYITDFINEDTMLQKALQSITIRKYNRYKVYIHNMANLDAIFLVKIMNKIGFVTPIINKGRIISIKLVYGDKHQYSVEFRDSYQLLLASLRKLGTSFKVDCKGIFPYGFVNDHSLDYIGQVPDYKYFTDINPEQYGKYSSSFAGINHWNIRS